MDSTITKKCSKCGERRPLDEFCKNKRARDGRSGECKECKRFYDRIRYLANKDEILCRNREWSANNRVWVNEYQQRRHAADPCERQAISAKYYDNHTERCRELSRRHAKENPEYYRNHARKTRAERPDVPAAHDKVKYEIQTGRITKASECEMCGDSSRRIVGHHEDYSKPLEITWLCDRCHRRLHAARNRAERRTS